MNRGPDLFEIRLVTPKHTSDERRPQPVLVYEKKRPLTTGRERKTGSFQISSHGYEPPRDVSTTLIQPSLLKETSIRSRTCTEGQTPSEFLS